MSERVVVRRPSDQEAEEAVKVLIRWIGDVPERKGLLETPRRVLSSLRRSFCGYEMGAQDFQGAVFRNDDGCSDMVLIEGIKFSSSCEHHVVPIRGRASIAYVPGVLLLGVGKIIKVVDVFAKRLQLQERLTVQVAHFLHELLAPLGVAVLLEAEHWCIECSDGVASDGLSMQTSCMLGVFDDDRSMRAEFFSRLVKNSVV